MLIAQKIAKKDHALAIAIIPRSFDQMAIADRDRDLDRKKKIAIDDQKIADHSCLGNLFIKCFIKYCESGAQCA